MRTVVVGQGAVLPRVLRLAIAARLHDLAQGVREVEQQTLAEALVGSYLEQVAGLRSVGDAGLGDSGELREWQERLLDAGGGVKQAGAGQGGGPRKGVGGGVEAEAGVGDALQALRHGDGVDVLAAAQLVRTAADIGCLQRGFPPGQLVLESRVELVYARNLVVGVVISDALADEGADAQRVAVGLQDPRRERGVPGGVARQVRDIRIGPAAAGRYVWRTP